MIYGAQGTALGAYKALRNLCPSRNILCFLVTEMGINAEYLAGVPVYELRSFSQKLSQDEKENILVLIAVPENVMPDIEKRLDGQGMFCHTRLTSTRWEKLMGYHYVCGRKFLPLGALPVGWHRADMHLFMAKYFKDRPLMHKYDMPEWVTTIQVGAALCGERVANILDCDGENISDRNGNYSELTALYWMWKNRLTRPSSCEVEEYYGLMHYRRVLAFTEDDALRLADNSVDVVLPYPMPYEPDIEAHHKRYIKKADWEAVKEAVWELHPEYRKAFQTVMKQKYFYNYNIVLAKKKVLEEYCKWLFPVLEKVEEYSSPKGIHRSDRYIGYIGESLLTLYFMHNRDRLNIVHTGCIFLT